MRWTSTLLVLASLGGASWGGVSAVGAAEYHVEAETRLTADRFRGVTPMPIERLDTRPRLTLGIYDLEGDGDATERLRFQSDLELGADFGPTSTENAALGQTRRAQFDLYFAYFELQQPLTEGVSLEARLGRHTKIDALGYDALDGATLRLDLPFVVAEGTAGLAIRRHFSGLGPDIYEPDGTPLSDEPGYVLGASLESDDLDFLFARLAFRRVFDDALQRAELGLSAEVMPLVGLSLSGGARYDLMFRRPTSLYLGAGHALTRNLRLEGTVRRELPVFSGDSIWNAFSMEPYDDLSGRLRLTLDVWRFVVDGGLRQFDSGPLDATAPGATTRSEAARRSSGVETRPLAVDTGLRLTRALTVRGLDSEVGAEARGGFGYGGRRIYGDVFGTAPVSLANGVAPLMVQARLGAVEFGEGPNPDMSGVSGWVVTGASWRAAESMRLEVLGEAHFSRYTPFRSRVFGQVTFEEWL